MTEDSKVLWIVVWYSAGLLVVLAALSYVLWNVKDPIIMYIPGPVLQWAFVGGVVGVLYRLAFRASDTRKGHALYAWIVAKPVVGLVMGAIVYFLAVSGELALNGQTEIKNIEFLNILAFIGGFSDRFSVDLLNRMVSKQATDNKPSNGDHAT